MRKVHRLTDFEQGGGLRPVIRHRALFLVEPTPAAAAAMRGWVSAGHEIAAIWIGYRSKSRLLRTDAQLARMAPQWSVKAVARDHALDVRQVPRLSTWDQRLDAVRSVEADVLISVYFRFIVPADVLEIYGPNAVNLHPAPLPRYRGPHPIVAMILDRSIMSDAAMTLHVMSRELDAGNIIARQPIRFPKSRSFTRLRLGTARAGRLLIETALPKYLQGKIIAEPQQEKQASVARVNHDDLALGPHLNVETIQWLCDMIGQNWFLRVATMPKIEVVGFSRNLGPPSGAAPRVGLMAMEMDVADARVRLALRRRWSKLARKLRELAIYIDEKDRA